MHEAYARAWSVGIPIVVADCRRLRSVPQPCRMQGKRRAREGVFNIETFRVKPGE